MACRGLVIAFYGYLNELGGWRTAAGRKGFVSLLRFTTV